MSLRKVGVLSLIILLAIGTIMTYSVSAAEFPEREIRVIVPWSPGGSTDVMARELQEIFATQLDINIVVENVEGGSSAVGLAQVMTSAPDGYTVGLGSSTIISLMAQDEVDFSVDDFTNIIRISEDPLVAVVQEGGNFSDLEELMQYVKDNPGEADVGTPGSKNVNHAMAELMAIAADSEINQVSYDGGSRVMTEIMGGHIDAGVLKPSEIMPQVEEGELKPIGAYTRERIEVFPEVPTFLEKGYDIFEFGDVAQITHVVAPAGLDQEIREELTNIFEKAMMTEQFQEFANQYGFIAEPVVGEELDNYVENIYTGMSEIAERAF